MYKMTIEEIQELAEEISVSLEKEGVIDYEFTMYEAYDIIFHKLHEKYAGREEYPDW